MTNQETSRPEPHPHQKQMEQYAQDAKRSKTPWEFWQVQSNVDKKWRDIIYAIRWFPEYNYRRKPRQIQPTRIIELPDCRRTEPEFMQTVYTPCLELHTAFKAIEWEQTIEQNRLLKYGMIYDHPKDAQTHGFLLQKLSAL